MSKTKAESRDLLTPAEAANYLKIKENTLAVWRCHKRYPLAYYRLGKSIRYCRSDLNDFIAKTKCTQ